MRRKVCLIVILLVSLILAGCGAETAQLAPAEAVDEPPPVASRAVITVLASVTHTPISAASPTPGPTDTRAPTKTMEPTDPPTGTPIPTETPVPTETPAPTFTPTPLDTPSPEPTATPKPTAAPTSPPRRLETGTVLSQVGNKDGMGELSIENGLDLDAVAILKQIGSDWQFGVWITNHTSYTIMGIPDSTYELYFSFGEDWDGEQRKFTRRTNRSRFEDLFPYETTDTTYSTWSVTLHPVAGGSAETESVPEGQFPDLNP